MAQTSVEWAIEKLNNANAGSVELTYEQIIEQAKEMHKSDCIIFANQWEARCNEKNMDSKEQLYEVIYKKII